MPKCGETSGPSCQQGQKANIASGNWGTMDSLGSVAIVHVAVKLLQTQTRCVSLHFISHTPLSLEHWERLQVCHLMMFIA